MNKLEISDVAKYVELNIGKFHEKRIEGLNKLQLKKILKRKNPYLFKAKHLLTSEAIIRGITDAHISSNEETIFGDWLEGLAIFINQKVYFGRKSSTPGVDLEFDNNGVRYIVSIKSGPNWGNDSSIKKMIANFNTARRVLRTSGNKINIIAVNGCCYGITTNRNEYKQKGDYYKYCGQKFWEFISGDSNLYQDLIEPLGHQASKQNEKFIESYTKKINVFTKEFSNDFCEADGSINWSKFVAFNSSKK